MAFDGVFLRQVAGELSMAYGCRVEKIHQPAKSELVLLLRKSGAHFRLLICLRPGAARIHFTNQSYDNPETPPMFCMLLRKYLCGAKFINVSQCGLDRVLLLHFDGTNEMGDRVEYTLAAEFIGSKSNLILINSDSRIIEALRRSDPESETRVILPGAVYGQPEPDSRLSVYDSTPEQLAKAAVEKGGPENAIAGLSPLIFREFEAGSDNYEAMLAAVKDLKDAVAKSHPVMTLSVEGKPVEYSFCPIKQYGPDYTHRTFDTYSMLLDEFYAGRDRVEMLRQTRAEISKTVSTLIARTSRKLLLRRQEQEDCKDREQLRINGELLKSNLSAFSPSAKTVQVKNYYSENLETITIKVDPALSPHANAARYFKEYKKSCVAASLLKTLISKAEAELAYFESVSDALSRAQSRQELDEIKEELITAGYIKVRRSGRKPVPAGYPKEYEFQGYHILCGKNNRQNDVLTFKTAGKNDLWLHARNLPGAHVILFCNNKPPEQAAVEYAAKIAARNSKGGESGTVPVDYTLAKFVKKPPGAKPGMVIYDKFNTVFVSPR